jgi:SAM-dependent methyltransferase
LLVAAQIGSLMVSTNLALSDFISYRRRRRRAPDGQNPLGHLRAPVPIARWFGWGRGKAIDRVFIEHYLAAQSAYIHGRVLEIGDNEYTVTYGGDRVQQSDILHFDEKNPQATFIGDLSSCDHIPDALFDCMILTQTLHLIYDIRAALNNAHRLLKPGGSLVATFPGISQISDPEWGATWCWGWSSGQAASLLESAFPGGDVEVQALGNRLAAVAMLHGLVAEEVPLEQLLSTDGACAFLIGAVAVRAAEPDGAAAC